MKNGLVVIGGSAGSLEVATRILQLLKENFKWPVVAVFHRKPVHESMLADVLIARTKKKVVEAEDKELIIPNTVIIAPADYHLLVETETLLALDASEKIIYSRPSIDVTFMSAASVYRENVIAVLLSGANADGAAGISAVHRAGGTTIVQEPQEAEVSVMPSAAIATGHVDHVLTTSQIAEYLNQRIC
jgi:two-component system chemotaxis response regulator CheB